MKFLPFAILGAILANAAPAYALTFNCSDPKRGQFESVCADAELVKLDREVDARLKKLSTAGDPLTRLLLRRDQNLFIETVGGQFAEFDNASDPVRQQIFKFLQDRLALLSRMRSGAVSEPAGEWANALAGATVKRVSANNLTVELSANVKYQDGDKPLICGLRADVKLRDDGWFAGEPVPQKTKSKLDDDDSADGDSDDQDNAVPKKPAPGDKPAELRLRLQGNTLRIVVTDSYATALCNGPIVLTGSYFAVGEKSDAAESAATFASRIVAPSFDCATARNSDEEEICSDPELARLDSDVARLYAATLKRLDARTATLLRDDQRAWTRENPVAYETYLHPGWDKRTYYIAQTSNAREELFRRQSERIGMLTHLDENRKGLEGLWFGHNAMAWINPAKDKPAGTLETGGGKWATGDYKSHCGFEGNGRIAGNTLQADDGPKFTRDGATLMVDGDDPDKTRDKNFERLMEQPGYCTRMDSAKARLFPLKSDAPIGALFERIR